MQTKINPWRRVAITVSAMLLVLLAAASFRFVQSRGVFTSVIDKTPASCRTVAGIGGVAAITPAATDGAYVATKSGELFLVATGSTTKVSGFSKGSHAIALSAGRGADGTGTLQAVMARDDGSYYVASFTPVSSIIPPALAMKEIGRLTTDMLTDPADLVSVDGARFYLVNRHGSHTGLGRWLDDAFLIPRAEILYFDGMKFVKVAERLNSPSGIALSPDGDDLFVAQGLPRNIVGFTRNDFLGALDHAALTNLDAAPGKITAAKEALIVAAAPKAGAGAVYRIALAGGVPQTPELLWSSQTETATAAAQTNGHLLIGTEKRLLDCAMK
jgi:hypothetical protein